MSENLGLWCSDYKILQNSHKIIAPVWTRNTDEGGGLRKWTSNYSCNWARGVILSCITTIVDELLRVRRGGWIFFFFTHRSVRYLSVGIFYVGHLQPRDRNLIFFPPTTNVSLLSGWNSRHRTVYGCASQFAVVGSTRLILRELTWHKLLLIPVCRRYTSMYIHEESIKHRIVRARTYWCRGRPGK